MIKLPENVIGSSNMMENILPITLTFKLKNQNYFFSNPIKSRYEKYINFRRVISIDKLLKYMYISTNYIIFKLTLLSIFSFTNCFEDTMEMPKKKISIFYNHNLNSYTSFFLNNNISI